MTIWPMAMILVPSIVGCLTALWAHRASAELFTEAFIRTANTLDKAAKGKTVTPETPKPRASGRHSARQARRPR